MSASPSRHNTAVYIPEEMDAPNLSKAQKKRRRLGRCRARAKIRQEEHEAQWMHASDAQEDEQSPSIVPSEEAELEASNDYYRHIVAARCTENRAECVQRICTPNPPAQDEELPADLREVERGECASSRIIGEPGQNRSSTTVSGITVSSMPDDGTGDDLAQEVAVPRRSKNQGQRRRQGKTSRAMAVAKLGQQEQLQSASAATNTVEV